MNRLAYRLGRIIGTQLRHHLVRPTWVESHVDVLGGGVTSPATGAQRIERVRQATDLRMETGMAVCHLEQWEIELVWGGSDA